MKFLEKIKNAFYKINWQETLLEAAFTATIALFILYMLKINDSAFIYGDSGKGLFIVVALSTYHATIMWLRDTFDCL